MQDFLNITLPALIGSFVTFVGLLISGKNSNKSLKIKADAAQDEVWLEIVKQSRIEYELQRKENNRLRYIAHHLQAEIQELEERNAKLVEQISFLRLQIAEVGTSE